MTAMSQSSDQTANRAIPVQASDRPLVSGQELWMTLGYPTANAFAQAARRKTTPVPVFSLAGRRGKHALRTDVVAWVAGLRDLAEAALPRIPGRSVPVREDGENQLPCDDKKGAL